MTTRHLRNVAIIAHVDHGKTTLVNQLLRSSGTFRDNEKIQDRALDHEDLEKEKGITILAKTTALFYRDYRINILDTPGHADFGGEVERIMHMVDGCLLLVDAFEGTMPQTRFVLKKALEAHVKPIVVINKMDKPNINVQAILDQILELFISLDAPTAFLDFPVVYTSALKGTASLQADINTQKPGMTPLLDLIIQHIPAPAVIDVGPFQWQAALLDYDSFVGRLGIGVIKRGQIKVNTTVTLLRLNNTTQTFKILKLFGYVGLKRVEINEAQAGDIVALAGCNDLNVGETVCDSQCLEAEPPLRIDAPTLQMTFAPNTSPFAGQDGQYVTARLLEERLQQETQRDVSLQVQRLPNQEAWLVAGRGELHLSILIEKMRREGYELEVSKPTPIIIEKNSQKYEPYEDVYIDVPNDYQGLVMDLFGSRNALLMNMHDNGTVTRFNYVMASRYLIGLSMYFLTLTHGYGICTHAFKEYRLQQQQTLNSRSLGVLVATADGLATSYAIEKIEEHGTMFIAPGTLCYEGMIIGEHRYNTDLNVNVTLEKHKTNVRSATKEMTIVLKAPRLMTLETCLAYINNDELVEITPHAFRLRKKILKNSQRKKNNL